MNLDIAVQHHPDRAALVGRLLRGLKPRPRVVLDPDPSSPVRSALRTYVACLESFDPDATHLLVLQDDTVVCPRFRSRAMAAIAEHPDDLTALFVPGAGIHRKVMVRAHQQGQPFAKLAHTWVPTVALVWPRHHAESFLSWLTANRYDPWNRHRGDDGPVGKWAQRHRVPVWGTVPSLVQHPDDTASLIGRRHSHGQNRSRVAAVYVG